MTSIKRWALGLEFDGSNYSGWQKQPDQNTIQGQLEQKLTRIANQPVTTHAAGRTDKGVHAKELIIHFDSTADRTQDIWLRALNCLLPADIRCLWVKPTTNCFHARHSAIARSYQYQICNKYYQPVTIRNYAWWLPYELNLKILAQALKKFLGTHDFSGFRGRDCQAKSPIKTILQADLNSDNNIITIDITGDAFLHHMVRNIVGALILIAQGKEHLSWLDVLLQQKNRHPKIPMAPAHGLTFVKAHYEGE